jgi:lysophospholipase L1-like esterase
MISLLALGDSYTIGEGVPLYDSFPYQAVQLLRKAGKPFYAPEILARTGWTTDELSAALSHTQWLPGYDFVSLLIGVNNQYRGRAREEYGRQFEELLQQAIRLATHPSDREPPAGKTLSAVRLPAPSNVFVLSIPDWSVSPFAHSNLPDTKGRDREAVSREIDAFNATAVAITRRYGIEFLDITEHTRLPPSTSSYAADGLHPSAAEYGFWAQLLAERISKYC